MQSGRRTSGRAYCILRVACIRITEQPTPNSVCRAPRSSVLLPGGRSPMSNTPLLSDASATLATLAIIAVCEYSRSLLELAFALKAVSHGCKEMPEDAAARAVLKAPGLHRHGYGTGRHHDAAAPRSLTASAGPRPTEVGVSYRSGSRTARLSGDLAAKAALVKKARSARPESVMTVHFAIPCSTGATTKHQGTASSRTTGSNPECSSSAAMLH